MICKNIRSINLYPNNFYCSETWAHWAFPGKCSCITMKWDQFANQEQAFILKWRCRCCLVNHRTYIMSQSRIIGANLFLFLYHKLVFQVFMQYWVARGKEHNLFKIKIKHWDNEIAGVFLETLKLSFSLVHITILLQNLNFFAYKRLRQLYTTSELSTLLH